MGPENRPKPKRKLVPSNPYFSRAILVLGRVSHHSDSMDMSWPFERPWSHLLGWSSWRSFGEGFSILWINILALNTLVLLFDQARVMHLFLKKKLHKIKTWGGLKVICFMGHASHAKWYGTHLSLATELRPPGCSVENTIQSKDLAVPAWNRGTAPLKVSHQPPTRNPCLSHTGRWSNHSFAKTLRCLWEKGTWYRVVSRFGFLFWAAATVVTVTRHLQPNTPGVGEQEDIQHSLQAHPGSAANVAGRKAMHPEVFFVPSMLGLTAPVSEKGSLVSHYFLDPSWKLDAIRKSYLFHPISYLILNLDKIIENHYQPLAFGTDMTCQKTLKIQHPKDVNFLSRFILPGSNT